MSNLLRYIAECGVRAALLLGCMISMALAEEPLKKPFSIYMVQWRGDTQTDKGFKDYFQNSRIAASYTMRNPQQDRSKFVDIVAEIKAQKPDLVYTWSMASAQGIIGTKKDKDISDFITDIPVVTCMVSDPAVAGLAQDWGNTNRNFTGASHVPTIVSQMRAMENFKPVSKLAIIFNSQQESPASAAQELEMLATGKGIAVKSLALPLGADGKSDKGAIASIVAELAKFDPDFLYIGPDSFLFANRAPLFDAINAHELPTFTSADVFLERGDALFGLVGSYYAAGQYCGYKAARILTAGDVPGDIPFDRLHSFSLKANMQTAKRLEIYPPMNMLTLTEVIKTTDAN